jgi:hypothetical protein
MRRACSEDLLDDTMPLAGVREHSNQVTSVADVEGAGRPRLARKMVKQGFLRLQRVSLGAPQQTQEEPTPPAAWLKKPFCASLPADRGLRGA